MENYSQEFSNTLNEAMNVRIELESIMENAVQISQRIIDQYTERADLSSATAAEPGSMTHFIAEDITHEEIFIANMIAAETEVDNEILAKPKSIRIYELAKDLQMPSKELMKVIKALGINVKSHMNVLDDTQLCLIREAIDSGLKTDNVITVFENDLINCQDIKQSEYGEIEEQSLQGMEFSMDELKKAHPYIAIKTMYDNGYQIREIAKLLGRGQGEVSLILNLSKKKAAGI